MDTRTLVRPMTADDVDEAEEISAEAFLEVDRVTRRADGPEPSRRSPAGARRWRDRTTHVLRTDPRGCWAAESRGRLVGVAISVRRDLTWMLCTYAVRPGLQGQGIGRPLLEAALNHSAGCLRAMLSASNDPRAVRRYLLAGFALHPQMTLTGVVDRTAIPVVEHVREGGPGDAALMDSVDRRVRDAAHGPDHPVLAGQLRLLVTDARTGSGYAYVDETGAPALLAATDRRTATRLLWEVLASVPPGQRVTVPHVTAANDWALQVAVQARLEVGTEGFLGLRGMRPPAPYLHHGALL